MPEPRSYDAVVVGGGAAGLMCAIEAGKRGRRVAVIEHNKELGRKILISGGGRCNFTNLHCRPENFQSQNPHFVKSALARYTPRDFIALVEKHKISYHEKKLGQLFCDGSAREIVALLRRECEAARVDIYTGCKVLEVRHSIGFVLETAIGRFQAPVLVVATGGLSIPKIGATDFGYRIARQFRVPIVEPYPALVPLTWSTADAERFGALAGVSMDVTASIGKQLFRENLLFTHRGLSGPAILQISSYWRPGEVVRIDALPDLDLAAELLKRKRRADRSGLKAVLADFLPNRFTDVWCNDQGQAGPLNALSDRALEAIAASLHRWEFYPVGTEGFAKAEVTGGGVESRAVSSQTLETKDVSGLVWVGEVLDVTGHLGGFNFQWAWASGFCAGQYI